MSSTGTTILLLAAGAAALAIFASTDEVTGPPEPPKAIWQWTISEVQGGGSWRGYAKRDDDRITTDWLPSSAQAKSQIFAMIEARGGTPAVLPEPIPVPPLQGVPAGPPITIVALRSQPAVGPTHQGALRSDGSWTISTTTGTLVLQSPPASSGEAAFLNAWNTYAAGGVEGLIFKGGIMSGFTVRPPGCYAGAPKRWCYVTTWNPGLLRHPSNTRAVTIIRALQSARSGT